MNQAIVQKFLDVKESCKIVSLRSFLPVDKRPSLHRINAIEGIFSVKEWVFGRESVSWMNDGGKYYMHQVNRNRLLKV